MSLDQRLRKTLMVALLTCSTFMYAQKQDLSRLITAIATVESKQNEKAVSGQHVGYLQISPIAVRECNNILKEKKINKKYTLNDRYNKTKSIEMFYLIQDKYNKRHNIEKAICIWNAGPNHKKKPIGYLKKVMKAYHNLK